VMYDQEELEQLQRFCTRHNLIVISDEIHCEFQLDKRHIPYFGYYIKLSVYEVKNCNLKFRMVL